MGGHRPGTDVADVRGRVRPEERRPGQSGRGARHVHGASRRSGASATASRVDGSPTNRCGPSSSRPPADSTLASTRLAFARSAGPAGLKPVVSRALAEWSAMTGCLGQHFGPLPRQVHAATGRTSTTTCHRSVRTRVDSLARCLPAGFATNAAYPTGSRRSGRRRYRTRSSSTDQPDAAGSDRMLSQGGGTRSNPTGGATRWTQSGQGFPSPGNGFPAAAVGPVGVHLMRPRPPRVPPCRSHLCPDCAQEKGGRQAPDRRSSAEPFHGTSSFDLLVDGQVSSSGRSGDGDEREREPARGRGEAGRRRRCGAALPVGRARGARRRQKR